MHLVIAFALGAALLPSAWVLEVAGHRRWAAATVAAALAWTLFWLTPGGLLLLFAFYDPVFYEQVYRSGTSTLGHLIGAMVVYGAPGGAFVGAVLGRRLLRAEPRLFAALLPASACAGVSLSLLAFPVVDRVIAPVAQFRRNALPAAAREAETRPTAMEALRSALPELRQRYAEGDISLVIAYADDGLHGDGRSDAWHMLVDYSDATWSRRSSAFTYLFWGELRGPGSGAYGPGVRERDWQMIHLDTDAEPPPFIDSTEAVQAAEQAGGAAYRAETRGILRSLRVGCGRSQGCTYDVFYSRICHSSLSLRIDARSGAVLAQERNNVRC